MITPLQFELERARMFCFGAHCAKGQKRKYSGEDYHVHPDAVMRNLLKYGYHDIEMLQAAYLHDVIEDTDVEARHIIEFFGAEVARLVVGLTNVPERDAFGNKSHPRVVQKKLDAFRLQTSGCPKIKTIKLADKLDNLPSIIRDDPVFARVYVPEASYLLDTALQEGDALMWAAVDKIICAYYEQNA